MKARNIQQVVPGRFTLIRRSHGVYSAHNRTTGQRRSLKTRDKRKAIELLNALNGDDADRQHAEQMAEIYQLKAGRTVSKITWAELMEQCCARPSIRESTMERLRQAYSGKDFNILRSMTVNQTHPDHFRLILKCGKPSVAKYLRTLQSFAIEHGWMTTPLLASKLLRVHKTKQARAITFEEYRRIIETERNPERKLFYMMLWATGAAQTDCANFRGENFDRETGVLIYKRQKTGCVCRLRWNGSMQKLLDVLPREGFLFPNVQKMPTSNRSSEFHRRCRMKSVNIEGVSLHSFRYAWAERAAKAGFSVREAQVALGQRSEAIHLAYAKNAEIVCSALPEAGDA